MESWFEHIKLHTQKNEKKERAKLMSMKVSLAGPYTNCHCVMCNGKNKTHCGNPKVCNLTDLLTKQESQDTNQM